MQGTSMETSIEQADVRYISLAFTKGVLFIQVDCIFIYSISY